MTTCGTMIKEWLTENSYDGLFNADFDCACKLDDLMPCGEPNMGSCCAGYIDKCNRGDWCEEFRILPNKTGKNSGALSLDEKYPISEDMKVIEECAELIGACGNLIKSICKMKRFGPLTYHPDRPYSTNIDDVKLEMSDTVIAIEKLRESMRASCGRTRKARYETNKA